MPPLHIVVVSGLSGSGKSVALRSFEDLGFFCVDNLPPPLILTFISLCVESNQAVTRIALGIDIREGGFLEDYFACHRQLRQQGHQVSVLFLETEDDVLLRRFSESRRPHPLATDRTVREGIALERQRLARLREQADWVIETSRLSVHQLKAAITGTYRTALKTNRLQIVLISFGYKFGLPSEADLLFDTRCLPNPHFHDALRDLTGESEEVSAFVLGHEQTKLFLDRLCAFVDFLLPQYEQEGRAYLTVGVGCTGGRHRSVVIVSQLARHLIGQGFQPIIRHRDVAPP
jgi:UPF0042 nucleotide-binding protein